VAAVSGVALVGVGRRRIVIRVTARTKARARAARPASWAPTTGAPAGSADVFATGRVRALLSDWARPVDDGFGSRVGNRVAALPFGPRVGLTFGTLGRLPTGSGEETVAGTAGRFGGTAGRFAGFSGCVRLCGVAGFCGAGFCGGAAGFCGAGFRGAEGFCGGAVAGGGAVIDSVADAAGSLAR
jgi:hypothetical protein